MSNILITGGLGYIGSYLSRVSSSHRLCIMDNMYTQRYCSLFDLNNSVKFIEDDFANISIEWLTQFDYVIHLAAIVDAANSFAQKDLVKHVNTTQTIDFVKKCRDANVGLIFPSSTSVYGVAQNTVNEINQEYVNPQSPYAESKVEVEKAIRTIHKNYVILRLATVCGVSPGIRFQTAINKFCFQAAFHQPITVWQNNYDMSRPYLTLQHLGDTISNMLWRWSVGRNSTYNVVTMNMKLKDILNHILRFVPYAKIKFTQCPLLNQFSYKVDANLIRKFVNIDPYTYSIYKEIENTLAHLGVKNVLQ